MNDEYFTFIQMENKIKMAFNHLASCLPFLKKDLKKGIFPKNHRQLYDASQYLLTVGGKRIRPVMCLMANEMFDEIKEDAYEVAAAIELFHNFTLIHDDIMDRAPTPAWNANCS